PVSRPGTRGARGRPRRLADTFPEAAPDAGSGFGGAARRTDRASTERLSRAAAAAAGTVAADRPHGRRVQTSLADRPGWHGRRLARGASDGRFDRRAAVKFLNVALAGRAEERFTREGAILGRLVHPNIAQLVDAGVSASGPPYLILEYVDGQ